MTALELAAAIVELQLVIEPYQGRRGRYTASTVLDCHWVTEEFPATAEGLVDAVNRILERKDAVSR